MRVGEGNGAFATGGWMKKGGGVCGGYGKEDMLPSLLRFEGV